MLEDLLVGNVYAFFVVFARLGAALMVMPGIGDPQVQPRMRIAFALGFTLVILPVVRPVLPDQPETVMGLFLLLAGEIFVGVFLGFFVRLILLTMAVAGKVISHMASLNAAQSFNPGFGSQGSLVGAFLTTYGILVMFAADLHHKMLRSIVESYMLFEPGRLPMFGDMADTLARTLAESFTIGLQLASPILIVGYVLYAIMGILARLMPQMPVFFVMIPLKFLMTALIMALTMSGMTYWFLSNADEQLSSLINNGPLGP